MQRIATTPCFDSSIDIEPNRSALLGFWHQTTWAPPAPTWRYCTSVDSDSHSPSQDSGSSANEHQAPLSSVERHAFGYPIPGARASHGRGVVPRPRHDYYCTSVCIQTTRRPPANARLSSEFAAVVYHRLTLPSNMRSRTPTSRSLSLVTSSEHLLSHPCVLVTPSMKHEASSISAHIQTFHSLGRPLPKFLGRSKVRQQRHLGSRSSRASTPLTPPSAVR